MGSTLSLASTPTYGIEKTSIETAILPYDKQRAPSPLQEIPVHHNSTRLRIVALLTGGAARLTRQT